MTFTTHIHTHTHTLAVIDPNMFSECVFIMQSCSRGQTHTHVQWLWHWQSVVWFVSQTANHTAEWSRITDLQSVGWPVSHNSDPFHWLWLGVCPHTHTHTHTHTHLHKLTYETKQWKLHKVTSSTSRRQTKQQETEGRETKWQQEAEKTVMEKKKD